MATNDPFPTPTPAPEQRRPPPTATTSPGMPAPSTPRNTAVGYDAAQVSIPTNETVEGRIQGIINRNSSLMKNAETRALQGMNRRGLVNSSMAVGAGQQAVLDTALPIAQQDSQSLIGARLSNANAQNTARAFTAGATNTETLQRLQGTQNLEQIAAQGTEQRMGMRTQADLDRSRDAILQGYQLDLQQSAHMNEMERQQFLADATSQRDAALAELEKERMGIQQGYNIETMTTQAQLDAARDQALAGIQTQRDAVLQQYNLDLQRAETLNAMERDAALADATTKRDQALADLEARRLGIVHANTLEEISAQGTQQQRLSEQEHLQRISELRTQGDITTERDRIQQQFEMDRMQAEQGNVLERDRLLAEATERRDNLLSALEERQISLQGDIEGRLRDKEIEAQRERDAAQQEYALALQEAGSLDELERIDAQRAAEERLNSQMARINRNLENFRADLQSERDAQLFRQDAALERLRASNETALQEIQNQFNAQLQASQYAAVLYDSATTAIGNILANPDLNTSVKEALIAHEVNLLRSGLTLVGGMNDIDISEFLDFSGVGTQPSNAPDWSPWFGGTFNVPV